MNTTAPLAGRVFRRAFTGTPEHLPRQCQRASGIPLCYANSRSLSPLRYQRTNTAASPPVAMPSIPIYPSIFTSDSALSASAGVLGEMAGAHKLTATKTSQREAAAEAPAINAATNRTPAIAQQRFSRAEPFDMPGLLLAGSRMNEPRPGLHGPKVSFASP